MAGRAGAVVLAIGVLLGGGVMAAGPSAASAKWALNGVFTATSNGEWARTNDFFHDEKSVRALWTIASQCS